MFNSTKQDQANNSLLFSYYAEGFTFECARCDFREDITVTGDFEEIQEKKNLECYTRAVAQMVAHHSMFIHPYLASFQGYDCVRFKLRQE